MSSPSNLASSLTGVWQGLYSYPSGAGETPFTATLIDFGSGFGGTTHETCQSRGGDRATLYAILDGRRGGHSVSFIKTYDGSGGWDHSVAYDGLMNAEGTAISGRWRVRGGLTGRFLMTRPAGKSEVVERRVAAEV